MLKNLRFMLVLDQQYQMEESEKRRERLKAMRMEAAQAEVSDVKTSAMTSCLSNPLTEPLSLPVNEGSNAVPRFDFYTDPMSAFSGNKRRSRDINQTPQDYFSPPISRGSPILRLPSLSGGPRNPNMTPPAHQYQTNYSPDQRIYEAPLPYQGSGSWRSPIGIGSPFPRHRGTPPGVWNGSGGITSYGFPSNSPRSGGLPSPGFERGGSPSPSSGRGRGSRFSNSPGSGSGRGGGRGRGFHAFFSGRERPELFYNKSMVEDPWKLMKPVVRNLNTPDTTRSWLPKSVSMKKARVSEAANESSSQSSLAECLAASFEEAVNDATNV
ncbi:hypothetical protein HHK36_003906 [Tetracentron sinense]|uniref:Uncharacterized protein n=1 Tax=Tetracentron sinense TaxID=13715 RepID=A0A834ZRX7_TETSI|nr:hypothetical protein HHK36_003906 [Tetracentron sinense]